MRPPRTLLAASIAIFALPGGGVTAAGDDANLEAARAGLARYLVDNRPTSPSESRDVAGCPAIELARFESALDESGIAAEPLGDWGTEIEWNEWEEIDPELMGIVCAGDADGDANDTDTLLGAGIAVIDAGSDEQALEVEQLIGFGALDAEPADVPGGEVMARCLDDDGLSLCMAIWTHDGFLVAVVLRSDEQDIPDGSGTAVLEDVLDDVLATLGSYEGGSPIAGSDPPGPATDPGGTEPTPTAGPLDIGAARAGLSARLGGMDEIDELQPLDDCPVAERDAVVDALETAGVDTPIESLLAEQGPSLTDGTTWNAIGLVCAGTYVGAEDDASFPELRIDVVVADFDDTDGFLDFLAAVHPELDVGDELPVPALGAGTIGECVHVDRTEQCAEYWEQDGFVVGVQIADRVFIDRPTASAVLGALVPSIVESLAAEPVVATDVGVTVPADVVESAREHVSILELGPELVECPFADETAIVAALAEAGIGVDLDDWSAIASEGAEGSDAGVACAGPAGRGEVRVEVLDFADSDAAQDVIELVHGCERVGDTEYCVESWEQDGLMVTVSVAVVGADIGQPDVRALVDALAPVVIDELAAS